MELDDFGLTFSMTGCPHRLRSAVEILEYLKNNGRLAVVSSYKVSRRIYMYYGGDLRHGVLTLVIQDRRAYFKIAKHIYEDADDMGSIIREYINKSMPPLSDKGTELVGVILL